MRAARLAYGIVLVFSCLLAFLVVQRIDEFSPLGRHWILQISGEPSRSASETMTALGQVAAEHEAALVRTSEDIRDPGRLRHVHVIAAPAGSEPERWLESGYPVFSRRIRTEVHPASAVANLDPRGDYLVFGDAATVAALRETIHHHGLAADSRASYEPGPVAYWLLSQPLGHSLQVMLLLCAVLVAMSVVLSVKRYAVQRLHGAGFITVVRADLLQTVRFLVVVAPVVWAGAAASLWLYNGGGHILLVAGWAAFFTAVMAAALAVVHLVALGAVTMLPVLESLKGKLLTSWGMALVYGVRVPATVLAAITLMLLAQQVDQVRSYDQARAAWASAAGVVTVSFNPRISPEEQDRLAFEVGRWLVAQEQAGRAILALDKSLTEIAPAAPQHPVLLVNDVYLQRHEVLDQQGRPVRSAPPGEVLVLIPGSLAAQSSQIQHGIESYLSHGVVTAQSRNGQRLFRYGSASDRNLSAFVTDPVVVVVNGGTQAIRPDDYMAYASQGLMLLTDLDSALTTATEHGITSFIIGYRPVAQDSATILANAVRDLRIMVASELAAALVLAATAVGAAILYARARHQRIFLRYISGWSFVRTHRLLLAVEVGVFLLTAALGPLFIVQRFQDPQPPSPWTVPLTTSLALASLAALVAALATVSRRQIRRRSSEA